MAIVGTSKIVFASTSSSASYSANTPGTFTPTADTLYLCWVTNSKAAAPDLPNAPTGQGLTWVQIATVVSVDDLNRGTLFRAMKPSGLTIGNPTVTFAANQTGCVLLVDEFTDTDITGTDGSGAIVQVATGASSVVGTSSSVTLAAFADAVNNAAYGAVGTAVNAAVTPEASYTELGDIGYGTPNRTGQTQYIVGEDLAVTTSWTGNSHWVAAAAEIKPATAVLIEGFPYIGGGYYPEG